MAILNEIPTIDISPWMSSNASQEAMDEVVKQVHAACTTYGFFNLVGHGVPVEAREKVWEALKLFFALPLEEKMKVSVDKSMGKAFRGYEPSLIQTHQEGLLPDTKECFITGLEVPAEDPDAGNFSTGPNLWPESLPKEEFQTPVMEYRTIMIKLVETLVKILGRGLPREWGCSPYVFDKLTARPSTPMRLLHYGPQTEIDPRQFGVGDHTDFGCVSVLLQEKGTKGLEVWYPPTETWIPVPVLEDAYVINIGNTMDKWTAGHYRSARHRVVNYTGQERNSIAFFLNGNLKLNIKPLDGSSDEEISISENIRSQLAHTMGKNGTFLR